MVTHFFVAVDFCAFEERKFNFCDYFVRILNLCNPAWLHLRDRVKRLCNRRFPRRLDKLERRVFMLLRQSDRSLSFQQRSRARIIEWRTAYFLIPDFFASTTHVYCFVRFSRGNKEVGAHMSWNEIRFSRRLLRAKALYPGIEMLSSILKQSFSRG